MSTQYQEKVRARLEKKRSKHNSSMSTMERFAEGMLDSFMVGFGGYSNL